MSILATTIWEMRQDSTANMVNGGGFNYSNANFVADGAWTSANTNAPVLSSATYNFVAGDVGAYIYSSNTTNPGFYKITSVATNKATVNGTIGQAEVFINGTWQPSTVVGVDSSASPTGKTFGVDYSRLTTAKIAAVTDFASVGASTNLTSATAGFTPVMVGNFFHLTTTGTGAFGLVGWYELTTYTNATTMITDRTTNSGTALVAGTGYVGGSLDLAGSLQQTFSNQLVAGNTIWIKYNASAYSLGGNITSTPNGTANALISWIGYNTYRGDNPTPFGTSTTAPLLSFGSSVMRIAGNFNVWKNINVTLSANNATSFQCGASAVWSNFKVVNTNSGTSAGALGAVNSGIFTNFEAVAYNGTAVVVGNTGLIVTNGYIHDSITGMSSSNNGAALNQVIRNNLIVNNNTGITITGATPTGIMILGNTIYGSNAKIGTGVSMTNVSGVIMTNNILTGLITGVSAPSGQQVGYSDYNNYYNNTTDVTNWFKGTHDIALDPTFTSVTEATGTGASITTTTLTDGSAAFNGKVVDNQTYVHITSITTGATGNYLITGHTNTTLTISGSNTGTNVVYYIPYNKNFAVGTNMRAAGFPGAFPVGLTTSYTDIGAVQRQEGQGYYCL